MPRFALAIAALLTLQSTLYAFSEGGHHLIAVIAYEQLDDDEQKQLIEMLKAHPRFKEDFAPPPKLFTDLSKVEDRYHHWLIGTAGYWPDIARRQPKYNRPTWHYQLAATLTIGDESKLKVPETPGPLPADATLDTQELHIAQAIALCRKVMGDKNAPAGDRAIALCWIGHLVADAHQPCHAGSAYVEGVFPEGDRGANSIPTEQSRNMHALWDGLLGNRYDEGDVKRRRLELNHDAHMEQIRRFVKKKSDTLNPLVWLAESREGAKMRVYTPEVLTLIRGAAEAGEMPKVYLSERYLKTAGIVARARAVQAAYRLAEVWREGL